MVHDRTLEFSQRGEALVEIPLGQARGQADAADAECPRALGSGDLEGGLHQPVPPVDAPGVGTDALEWHRHLVFHPGPD